MNPIRALDRVLGRTDPALAAEPALEPVYRALFVRELEAIGETDRFFPVGGAANYSLLYLILRIGIEIGAQSVLDIGAGQSSLLWSLLRRRGFVRQVTTLESDSSWGAAIGREVDHRVLVTPLAPRMVEGRSYNSYDWGQLDGPFDVIVCDGPNGVPRHSRGGVLALLDKTLPDDFVLVLDDAERRGEQDTVDAIHRRLQALGRSYRVGVVRAAKTQVVFAGGRSVGATFL